MNPVTRSTRKYYFRKLDLLNLRKLGLLVTNHEKFNKCHEYLLNILKTNVEEGLLNTLVQFYDPAYHCFTFLDYQLVPTLEEYFYLIGLPLSDKEPFNDSEPTPKTSTIATALSLEPSDMVHPHYTTKGGFQGLTANFLHQKAISFAQNKKTVAFHSLLALLIYGLVLFPDVDGFVNINAIKIFLTKNPVPTLLADTYHSIHDRTDKGQGTIRCYAQLLYKWFLLHLPNHFRTNPDNVRWSQKIMSLTPADIVWYNAAYDTGTIIDSCGEFPNVPLIGIRERINYNPALAMRQFRYPMERPRYISLDGIFYLNQQDSSGMRGKFERAWRTIHKKGKGQLGRRSSMVSKSYTQWVIDRAAKYGMPYPLQRVPSSTSSSTPSPIPLETREDFQEQLTEAKLERDTWQRRAREAELKNETLSGEIERLKHQLLDQNRRLIEKDDLLRRKDALLGQDVSRKRKFMELFDGPHPDFE